jgi:hypothetical protein
MASKTMNAQARGPDLRVIANAPCAETVAMAREFLDFALCGEVVGVAIVGMVRNGDFYVDTFGQARRDPIRARGMLRSLDEHLGRLVDRNE